MTKPNLKKLYLSLSSALVLLLPLPFVFAKNKPVDRKPMPSKIETVTVNSIMKNGFVKVKSSFSSVYDSLRLNLMGLSKQTFDYAIKGFNYLVETGKVANDKIISIVDFSLPSTEKRLFVIDLDQQKVLFNTYVAHGRQSGTVMANDFSNTPESYKSSLGFYETLNTYTGHNGYSLRLEGLEHGFNDNANERAIVIHGADYVNEGLIKSQGYIGRSWGCPALPQQLHKPIIDKIKNGTCLFIYSPDQHYINQSKILNAAA